MRRAILLFVKFPEPGRVKTRLAADVGAQQAAAIYGQLVRVTCAQLPVEKSGPSAQIFVNFDPPERRREVEQWLEPMLPRDATFVAQCAGDLGTRLTHAFAHAFAAGFEKAVAIGTDCCELTESLFETAFENLDAHDCAIGPTLDGGYYLIALKQPQPALFTGIAWSTDQTFAQTLDRARDAGLSVALLPPLRDVDTESDWKIAESFLEKTNDESPSAAV
jgi:rSAM/selenodomain-associated transferase 1